MRPRRKRWAGEMTSSYAQTYSNYSPDWWTPERWLAWVRETFERDYFDPCPGDWQKGEQPSGLDLDWQSPCYVNHPGSRGSAQVWWSKYLEEKAYAKGGIDLIWCAFSVEQLRHMDPSPMLMSGYLVLPKDRVGFVWGGPDIEEKRDKNGKVTQKARKHGDVAKSPGNWTVFWSTVPPADPPDHCLIIRTGPHLAYSVGGRKVA